MPTTAVPRCSRTSTVRPFGSVVLVTLPRNASRGPAAAGAASVGAVARARASRAAAGDFFSGKMSPWVSRASRGLTKESTSPAAPEFPGRWGAGASFSGLPYDDHVTNMVTSQGAAVPSAISISEQSHAGTTFGGRPAASFHWLRPRGRSARGRVRIGRRPRPADTGPTVAVPRGPQRSLVPARTDAAAALRDGHRPDGWEDLRDRWLSARPHPLERRPGLRPGHEQLDARPPDPGPVASFACRRREQPALPHRRRVR